ncbi:MAG: PASTA domain-containing protein, partial [Candidatus Limnocylindria bacterium]
VYVPPRVSRPADRVPSAPPPSRRDAYRAPAQQGQPWWIWVLALLAIGLLGVIGFLGYQLLGGLSPVATPSPTLAQVEVPDWEGDPLASVQLEAARLGLRLETTRENSDTVDEDHVISQAPSPGTPVGEGSTVSLVVSSGQEQVTVPTLAGQTRDEAVRRLEAAGLNLGEVTHEPSAQQAETVLRSIPSAGTTVAAGSEVALVLSSGPTPEPTPSPTPTPAPTPPPTLPPTPTPTPPPAP